MIQLNLIPDVKLELVKSQRHRTMVVSVSVMIVVISLVFLTLLSGYVFGVQSVLISNVTNEIKKKDEDFRNISDIEKTVTVSNQLNYIQASHESKTISSRIFDLLAEASSKDTENSVTINSFDVDSTQHSISIIANTEKRGFDAAEVFRKNIEGMKIYYLDAKSDDTPNEYKISPATNDKNEKSTKIASDVRLSEMVLARNNELNDGSETVSFRIDFTYDPILFDEKIDMLRIRGLDRGNVTDSYTRLPTSLFADPGGQKGGL